ncbi:hypothetical protein JDV02_010391 [Purpureocillium takamizusanense]|uniref:Uncharacterized protein n=1 Tax=Purpureocillium takamizusanense TaxID=2060973 RepID=A0A9Q8QTY3_9HYPO|nr:uncharacterized protein JDV02_010391 [Purpureocillium takamizusanense]UNI24659.1 hypothetical protein JDV02_010391 [Purpureocillium takamizusanense]
MVRAHCFDAVFLCFDVQNGMSMRSIVSWWTHARARAFTKESPFQMGFDPLLHLVGLKKDLRLNIPAGMSASHFVNTSDAQAAAASIGAHRYIECSAKTHEAMDALFDDAGREATRRYIARSTRAARAAAAEAEEAAAQAQTQTQQARVEEGERSESPQKRQRFQ